MIHCFVEKEHQIWDESLPILTSAIRSIVNRQTGYTSNMLMLGRVLTMPIDIMLGMAELRSEEQEPKNYVDGLQQTLTKCHDYA